MIKRNSDAGQVLVVVALCMIVLLGFMGLGIDMGYLRYMKRQLQKAADAAAIAGAQELVQCPPGTFDCTALTTAAQDALTENGLSGSTLVTDCGTSTESFVVTVNNPPCYVSTDPHLSDNHYVEVIVSQAEPLFFSQIFGEQTATLTARAEAGLESSVNCIYALDPSDTETIAVDFEAAVNANCGVEDESSSSSAFYCYIGALKAASISVFGGSSTYDCSVTPAPKIHQVTPTPADPLAYLPTPSVGSCGASVSTPYTGYSGTTSGLLITGTATLNQGTYCGGIEISETANVTFEPGIYVLTSPVTSGTGYGLTIDIGAAVLGSGVTFYNTLGSGSGSPGAIYFYPTACAYGGTGVSLTAPTSGTYEGLLFFQDPSNANAALILGSTAYKTSLQGSYYFPKAKVKFAYSGTILYNILDAYQIEFAAITACSTNFSTSTFYNNYTSLVDGSPAKGSIGLLGE
jgi:Flp pilus assembly protein TadG